jgi:ribosomal protein L36
MARLFGTWYNNVKEHWRKGGSWMDSGQLDMDISKNLQKMERELSLKTLLHRTGIVKKSGIETINIINFLLSIIIKGLTIGAGAARGAACFGKDAAYRLKNRSDLNWRSLQRSIGVKAVELIRDLAKTGENIGAMLILDDTFFQKTGWRMEGSSICFDHTSRLRHLGVKCLVCAIRVCGVTIPVDFSLHSERKHKKSRLRFWKDAPPRSHGAKRRKELEMGKPEAALSMIKGICRSCKLIRHVLSDSWFTSFNFIKEIRGLGIHVIAGIKRDGRYYVLNGKKYNLKQLFASSNQKMKRMRGRKLHYYEFVVEYPEIGKVKLLAVRYNKAKDWRGCISTDISLDAARIMAIYAERWSIEVLFKETKGLLRLGKSQSRDLDGQIADCSLAFILYTMLVIMKKKGGGATIGSIFRRVQAQAAGERLVEGILEIQDEALRKAFEAGAEGAGYSDWRGSPEYDAIIGFVKSSLFSLLGLEAS